MRLVLHLEEGDGCCVSQNLEFQMANKRGTGVVSIKRGISHDEQGNRCVPPPNKNWYFPRGTTGTGVSVKTWNFTHDEQRGIGVV